MKVLPFTQTTFIPADRDTCWAFFSDPSNLQRITPPSMDFRITSDPSSQMYAGQIITYRVRPLAGIPVTWVTEITQVREGSFFIDEQRIGPYRFWHHQHHFREVEGGTEMTDIVHYALPLDPLSRIMLPMVRGRLRKIFAYREKVIRALFRPVGQEQER